MTDLSDRKYKAFVIGDIFQISTGALLPKSELKSGRIPRITVSEASNGIVGTFAPSSHKNYRVLTNFISVSFLGTIFYHSYTASLDMKIHGIQIPEVQLNKELGAFLVSVLRRTVANFSYGDQLSSTDLPQQKIMLPVDESGKPDWQFMTNYMAAHRQNLIARYQNYIAGTKLSTKRERVDEALWREFSIQEIFDDIQRGKRIKKADHIAGNVPYIASKAYQNGIDGFVGNKKKVRVFSDCLTFANSGSVGSSFYHPYPFVASDHVTKLSQRVADRHIYLFLATVVSRLAEKYSYNREINNSRIKREKVILPVKDSGAIDYDFMRVYAQKIEAEQLSRYVAYLKTSPG